MDEYSLTLLDPDFSNPHPLDALQHNPILSADATEDEGDYLPDGNADAAAPPSSSRRRHMTQGMNDVEKKERQKQQNRKAAERSRHKKRLEQYVLSYSSL